MVKHSCEAKVFDLAIIGGGISGLGLAMEAGSRGLKSIIIEKNTCLSETSNNSLRIIHGGFRYLQSLNIKRTLASLKEQAFILEQYSRYIKPLPCVMPLRSYGLKSKYPAAAACMLYNLLYKRTTSSHYDKTRIMSRSSVEQKIPVLKGLSPNGALAWQDGLIIDPAGFKACIVEQAERAGTHICQNSEVLNFERYKEGYTLRCQTDKGPLNVRSKIVVNAAGPWIEAVRERGTPSSENGSRKISFAEEMQWCRAFNIVIDRQLEPEYAFGLMSQEGRLFFTVPRNEASVIGTFYVPAASERHSADIAEVEIQEALSAYNMALPSAGLDFSNVVSVDSGILPLKSIKSGQYILQGSEKIKADDGYLEILSTKYTTFRNQAKKVMLLVDRELRNA